MSQDFIAYKKFTDKESAEHIVGILETNDIQCHLEDQQHAYVKIVGYNQIDFGITLNIKEVDFVEADKILEKYYAQEIQNVDSYYYLFEFTDQELKEIIENPFDWGQFDFQLAKQILKSKGVEFGENYLQAKKDEKIAELSTIKKVPFYTIIAGYIFSIILPPIGLLIGVSIYYHRNILPNGYKFYIHSTNDRRQGKIIITISIIWIIVVITNIILQH